MLYQDAAADLIDVAPPDPAPAVEARPRLFRAPEPGRVGVTPDLHAVQPRGVDSILVDEILTAHPRERHHASPDISRFGAFAKRSLDIVGALALTLVLSPLLLVLVVLLTIDHGPILYSHPRTGRYGKTFGCLKFRTMVPNADQALRELLKHNPNLQLEWMRDHKLREDPRVTRIGRFLRRTSLDELPQLWNVLRGDMSLVGPRPVVRDELQRYGRRLDKYLTAKPGVTGLWQVMGRSDTCYRRRVALDTYYVRRRSLRLDIYILARTVKVVLRGNGAC